MHGFLVLPAAGYLIWCRRREWMPLVPTPNSIALVMLMPLGVIWFVGEVTSLIWLQQIAVVAMLPTLAWVVLGNDIVRILAWPLGFLMFMIPVGTSLDPWLQDITARFIEGGLELSGIPYLYKGRQFVLTSGAWDVAPDCGGLRYLLPGLALGYAYVTLLYRKPSRRFAFLLLCAVVLMVANGIRAFAIIIGDHYGIAEGADHRLFSYSIYGLTMPLLFWWGLKWEERPEKGLPLPVGESRYCFDTHKPIRMAIIAVTILAVAPISAWLWIGLP